MLFCRQNCEAHERRLVNRNGIGVECRDLDPASNRLQLSLPHHCLISIRMRRWAAQTANLHCVGERLPRMMPDVLLIIIIIMRRYYYYKVGTDFSDTL